MNAEERQSKISGIYSFPEGLVSWYRLTAGNS
jgi:hypothetical protein